MTAAHATTPPAVLHVAPAVQDAFSFDAQTERLRQVRMARVQQAVQQLAEVTRRYESLKRALEQARVAVQEAEQAIKKEMERGERVLLGSTLLTLNKHGGLEMEPVIVCHHPAPGDRP